MTTALVRILKPGVLLLCGLFALTRVHAQTEVDGIMMSKNNFCTGFMYSYSSWDEYWEGTLKRSNLNLGTISTQMIGWMGNYGITDKINVLASLPYVKTKASAGTLHGVDGIQDLSVSVKYKAYEKSIKDGKVSFFGVAGYSLPVTNYLADYQPLAIGLRSQNLSLRGIADMEYKHFFYTLAFAYIVRSNVTIDRDQYYTTELHNTNKVDMPDATNFHARFGYRGNSFGGEVVVSHWQTLGGFDITRNNMPFPSNRMNATMVGGNLKCNPRALPGLSIMAGVNYVVDGRNMGQSMAYSGGFAYVFDFSAKAKASKK